MFGTCHHTITLASYQASPQKKEPGYEATIGCSVTKPFLKDMTVRLLQQPGISISIPKKVVNKFKYRTWLTVAMLQLAASARIKQVNKYKWCIAST